VSELVVEARSVRKSFGRVEVLRGVDLEVERGQVVCVVGPSGSGKSTLLRCMNHLERFESGQLFINGSPIGYESKGAKLYELRDRDISRQRRDVGMVFQHFNLFRHMTVLENLTLGPVIAKGEKRPTVERRARLLLERVGLKDREKAYPGMLSGGQQQRVAIARALCMEPSLLLFDEPTSALDPELVGEVLEVIKGLALGGMTMIVVTHEINFARDVADQVVVMDAGVIIESGPPDAVLTQPTMERTRQFLASVR
jgi:polar amino acid transport system ATP-binding protein